MKYWMVFVPSSHHHLAEFADATTLKPTFMGMSINVTDWSLPVGYLHTGVPPEIPSAFLKPKNCLKHSFRKYMAERVMRPTNVLSS